MGTSCRFNWYQESTLLLLSCCSSRYYLCWPVLISAAERTDFAASHAGWHLQAGSKKHEPQFLTYKFPYPTNNPRFRSAPHERFFNFPITFLFFWASVYMRESLLLRGLGGAAPLQSATERHCLRLGSSRPLDKICPFLRLAVRLRRVKRTRTGFLDPSP